MYGRFSSYIIERWLDDLVSNTIYLTLFTSDPFVVADPLTAELYAPNMVRGASVFEKVAPGMAQLANEVQFRGIPQETTVVAVGGFDEEVNGNLLFRELLAVEGHPQPYNMPAGGVFVVPEGTFVLGLDVSDDAVFSPEV